MKNCNQLSESGIKTYVFDTRINENIECDSKIKKSLFLVTLKSRIGIIYE